MRTTVASQLHSSILGLCCWPCYCLTWTV